MVPINRKLPYAADKAINRIFQPTCGEPPTDHEVGRQEKSVQSLWNADIKCVIWLSSFFFCFNLGGIHDDADFMF